MWLKYQEGGFCFGFVKKIHLYQQWASVKMHFYKAESFVLKLIIGIIDNFCLCKAKMLNTPATLEKPDEHGDIRVKCMKQDIGTNILDWNVEHRDIC